MINERESKCDPRLSIGLPVYNGSRYLVEAIQSVLNQTFTDFELIICDNASTDETEEICNRFASQDDRIRYFRNEKNIGAGPNFNLAVDYARGEYFKWAAHDDICHPEFFEKCIQVLDSDKSVVLAYPKSEVIDEGGNRIDRYSNSEGTSSEDPVARFRDLLIPHICFQVFGVMRLADLRKTPLIGLYARGDEIFLCWMGLRGRFHQVDGYLFYPRRHDEQSMKMLSDKKKNKRADFVAYSEWFDPRWRNRMVFPWWKSLQELVRCVANSPLTLRERFKSGLLILRWMISRRGSLVRDLMNQLNRVMRVREEVREEAVR